VFAVSHTQSVTAVCVCVCGQDEVLVVLNFVVGIVTTRFERVIASVRSELPHFSKSSGLRLRIRKRTSRFVVVVCIPADQLEIFSREVRNVPGIFKR